MFPNILIEWLSRLICKGMSIQVVFHQVGWCAVITMQISNRLHNWEVREHAVGIEVNRFGSVVAEYRCNLIYICD